MGRYICIHGHFYQPPRENAWLEAIEYQESAYPYHDWNERVTAECYEPNGVSRILNGDGRIDKIVNNYSRISFNFGPTLLSWLADKAPEVYAKLLEADEMSMRRFSAHGSAIAQAYGHCILPLCNSRDKYTQIQWGLRDFQKRFGRMPESMWLPETAVDLESLDILARARIKFVILAPNQARRFRKRGDRHWRNAANSSIDPSMAYEIVLPSGRRMGLFFYDGPISRAVAFEKLLSNGDTFAGRLMGAFSDTRTWPQLVNIATDGETYGHHQAHGEMGLSYALEKIECSPMATLTNYGEYLEKNPSTHLVDIWENSSWSCVHGVGRWKENCGCNSGMHPEWHQEWRAPLRAALDWLRDQLAPAYEAEALRYLKDPWAARDDYIDVVMDRSPESISRFLKKHASRLLSEEETVITMKLMELQRHAMLMFTSCGWFFDELSGIETVQVIQYAGRAIQLAHELFGHDGLETSFLELLEKAPSNIPENVNGRVVYEKFVRPAMVDRDKVVGHYAVSSLFTTYPEHSEIYSYYVDRTDYKVIQAARARLNIGRCRITSRITYETGMVDFAVVYMGDHNVSGGVRQAEGNSIPQEMIEELTTAFSGADFPGIIRLVDKYFGKAVFSLRSLFRDEQRRVLDMILESVNSDIEALHRQAFERAAPLMRFLMNLGLQLPKTFREDATTVLNAHLRHALDHGELDPALIDGLLDQVRFWQVELDAGLEFAYRHAIEKLADTCREHPGDLQSIKKLVTALNLAKSLPFAINLYKTQNIYYELMKSRMRELMQHATAGDPEAREWVDQFARIGDMLSIKVPSNG